LLVKRAFFLLNAALARAILDLISHVRLASFVMMLRKFWYDGVTVTIYTTTEIRHYNKQWVCVFWTNSGTHSEHSASRGECSLCGTNWILNYSSGKFPSL